MKINDVGDDQLIEQVVILAVEYKRRFGKSLGITSEVGEYRASQLLNLKRAPGNINEGFDARDRRGRRVQIKSRVLSRRGLRTGNFTNFSFDYALLVLLSEDYEVIEIWKAECGNIKKEIQAQSYKNPSLSFSRFKRLAKRVYP